MSMFNALNSNIEGEQYEADEHSRELQIEQSFNILQDALIDLKNKDFQKSDSKFQELFQIDVVKPDRWGIYRNSSPTLDNLRYLCYRNRGMYYHLYLESNYENLSSQELVNCILKAVENLVESIQHSDADFAVTDLLARIFKSFNSVKLERLISEYEFTKEENLSLLLGRHRKFILKDLTLMMNNYIDLTNKLLVPNLSDNTIFERYHLDKYKGIKPEALDFGPVLLRISEMKREDEEIMKKLDVFNVTLNEESWDEVAKALKTLLPSVKTSSLIGKNMDPYNEVEEPIEAVKFGLSELINNTPSLEKDFENQEEEQDKEGINVEDKSGNPAPSEAQVNEEARTNKRPEEHVDNAKPLQRSSKRFKEKEHENSKEVAMEVHKKFFAEFNTLLSYARIQPFCDFDTFASKFAIGSDGNQPEKFIPYTDLYECLKSWNSRYTDIFNQNDYLSTGSNENEELFQLNALLKSNAFDDKESFPKYLSDLDSDHVKSFISEVNTGNLHFHQVRFKLLFRLLGTYDEQNERRLIIDYLWESQLLKTVLWFLFGIESNIFAFIDKNRAQCKYLALSIYELLVNHLGNIVEEITNKRIQGHKSADLKSQRNKVEKRITSWHALLEQIADEKDTKLYVHFQWTHYCFLQYTCDIVDNRLSETLTSLENTIKNSDSSLDVAYPNYRHIPALNLNTVQSQKRKIKIIQNITVEDISEDMNSDSHSENHLETLERVLLHILYPSGAQSTIDEEMVSFIFNSPFLLKIRLWGVLFSSYVKKSSLQDVQRIYFHVLDFMKGTLTSPFYKELTPHARHQMLLTVLTAIGYFSSQLTKILNFNRWENSGFALEDCMFDKLLQTFFFFYTVLFYESSAVTGTSNKSFFKRASRSSGKMKDIMIDLSTLILYYYNFQVNCRAPAEQGIETTELIWSLHTLFGYFHFCDASNGKFLNLSEKLLCQFINNDSFLQLKQILWCRYHYTIASDNFSPDLHDTKPVEMEKIHSLPLGTYLIKLQYQNKNPYLSSSKTTLKQIMDNIIEKIGDPSTMDNHIISRNTFLLNEYLSKPITANLLKDTFSGYTSIYLTTPHDELQQGMTAGLFYVSSLQSLGLYKMRKKSMQARPSELDSIIRMLKNDIIYNTNRFESWILLGKCYNYIVEDDLIWTSDKITVPEKKEVIALTQRKAILCYSVAISIYYSKCDRNIEDKKIILEALDDLGSILISGYYNPMNKLCFSWKSSAENTMRLSETGEVIVEKTKKITTISDFNIEQSIFLCFNRACCLSNSIKLQDDAFVLNWFSFYSLAKFFFKTDDGNNCKLVANYVIQSCQIAHESSPAKDPIIEPHYLLVNACYKWIKKSIMTVDEALALLAKDNQFFQEDDAFWVNDEGLAGDYQEKVFFGKIIRLLHHLLSVDKKKWQHRPRYRIARILFDDFGDVDGALKEMDSLISAKSANKNLVNIWKPDFERPGKHFIYTYQYLVLYLDLLSVIKDFNTTGLVIKKLRRFGSGTVNINELLERAISVYTQSAKIKLQLQNKSYVEQILPALNYQKFLKISEQLNEVFDQSKYPEDISPGLKLAFQLKKGHSGIAFDGVCLGIYFEYLYYPLAQRDQSLTNENDESSPAPPSSGSVIPKGTPDSTPKPSVIKKRVTKKEVFDRIRLLVDKIT
ncbi:hir3p [Saccharomyces arboricola H-6]|uniref:Hir3p n=1 Tax=Saccharomyces arboricola (strain H-6 / AS 2.3317 / CBS 10644) TaxID=1160507 RepID=J8Q0H1_SACAR|nr:hir3p [Saccharomyces arboricola H-6]